MGSNEFHDYFPERTHRRPFDSFDLWGKLGELDSLKRGGRLVFQDEHANEEIIEYPVGSDIAQTIERAEKLYNSSDWVDITVLDEEGKEVVLD